MKQGIGTALSWLVLFVLAGGVAGGVRIAGASPSEAEASFEAGSLDATRGLAAGTGEVADRGEILQLLSLYAHLFDEVGAEAWSELFVEDAIFEIAFAEAEAEADAGAGKPVTPGGSRIASRWIGRAAILEVMGPRRAYFETKGVQRRHYLSNPVVYDLEAESARVAVYLMLVSIDAEGTLEIVGTGRYKGRVVKSPGGWRIEHWRLEADGPAVEMSEDTASEGGSGGDSQGASGDTRR